MTEQRVFSPQVWCGVTKLLYLMLFCVSNLMSHSILLLSLNVWYIREGVLEKKTQGLVTLS